MDDSFWGMVKEIMMVGILSGILLLTVLITAGVPLALLYIFLK